MEELKKEVEALLFASAKAMSLIELSTLLKQDQDTIKNAVDSIRQDLDHRDTALTLVEDPSGYRITVKEKYTSVVQKIVLETELPKTILETLAIIAYKHPALQSEIIRIRTNKAYDHLRELEELGYITREKHSRTKRIKLTDKFFHYFDLPQEKLREAFSGFAAIEKVIEEKQQEARRMREEIKKRQEEQKKTDDEKRQNVNGQIQDLDKKNTEMLGTLTVVEELPPEEPSSTLGGLEVVKMPEKKKETKKKRSKELHVPDKNVEKRAAELLSGSPESNETNKTKESKEQPLSDLDQAAKDISREEDELKDAPSKMP